jgi:oxygen-independent coproporphyrinogen-3 oxidase
MIQSGENMPTMLQAYLAEIKWHAEKLKNTHMVKTIFFGGGTPSLMNENEVESILKTIHDLFSVSENPEITLEANPTSFEIEKFKDFKLAGINRISIGVQSFNDDSLSQIGRKHSSNEAKKAIENGMNIFGNVSFDLMFGLPNQTIDMLGDDLKTAMQFNSQHISIYNLTIEKGTEFFIKNKNKLLNLPKPDTIDQMDDLIKNELYKNSFARYEVSNYSKKDFESKHNIAYWKIKDYIGIGPGAHGRFTDGDKRYESMTFHNPTKWYTKILNHESGFQKLNPIDESDQIKEILLMGLRIFDGIDIKDIKHRLNIDLLSQISTISLKNLSESGMIQLDSENNILKPTTKGIDFVSYISKCLFSH